MKLTVCTLTAAMAASVMTLPSLAQDWDVDSAEDGVSVAADAAEGDAVKQAVDASDKLKKAERIFTSLPFCSLLDGHGECKKPGSSSWEPAEEGVYYPLGTEFRTTDGSSQMAIRFSPLLSDAIVVSLKTPASFATREQPLGDKTRAIALQSGTINVTLPRNLPDSLFSIVSGGFKIVNPKGESRIAYIRTTDGEAAQIRCVTGTLSIEGRHFKFPELKAADEVKIRTSQDGLFTGLYGNRGDCLTLLDQGLKQVKNFATGEVTVENKPLEWKLSPRTAVRIHRALPSIGERMSVTIMTFDAAGELKNRCAFAEGREDVNSGELAPSVKRDREALAKQAAAAAETVAVEVDVEADAEEEGEAGDSSESEAASGSGDDDLGF